MHSVQIKQDIELNTSAQLAFEAWLDSAQHSEMIEGTADIDPTIGGKFSIWEDGVTGKTTLVDRENLQIEQLWRYNYDDWPEDKPSEIKLWLEQKNDSSAVLHFEQCCVPDKYVDEIAKGWQEYYWKPMQKYFESKTN